MDSLEVCDIPVNDLRYDDKHARKHNARNLATIKESLIRYGQRKPIVALLDGMVVAGNGTLEVAKSLGWTHISVAYCPADWSLEQARAYALADNRTAELAEWDTGILAGVMDILGEFDIDMELLGFDDTELCDLLGDEKKEIIEDEVPPDESTSKITVICPNCMNSISFDRADLAQAKNWSIE